MMEVLTSESGSPVVRWQGLSLASTRQPEKEAQEWVKKAAPLLSSVPHIIVLGLGCGYHVFELIRQFPQKSIYVFEVNRELIQFCQSHFSLQMADVNIIEIRSLSELSMSARAQRALSQPYSVLEHWPSLQPQRSFYKELSALLKGRDPTVFRDYLELRPGRKDLFDERLMLEDLLNSETSLQLLSVKDLERWLHPDRKNSKTGGLIQVLRELVK